MNEHKSVLKSTFKPLVKGRHGSAPMSNWVARFALAMQILAGMILTVIDYWTLLSNGSKVNRLPSSAWWPGVIVTLIFWAVLLLVWFLDKYKITADSPLAIRHTEKRILLSIASVDAIIMLGLALILA